MTNTASDDMPDLRRRIERIEAVEACRDRFNSYLYSLDAGHLEELLDLFADEARLELKNFPPGTGGELVYSGPDEIRGLYTSFVGEGARHHSANVSVAPSDDLGRVEMTAYFHTSLEYALTGGIYELQLQPRSGEWQVTRMGISSTWGWGVPHTDPPFLKEPFGAGTLRDGRGASSVGSSWD
jgi:hypothetical protein